MKFARYLIAGAIVLGAAYLTQDVVISPSKEGGFLVGMWVLTLGLSAILVTFLVKHGGGHRELSKEKVVDVALILVGAICVSIGTGSGWNGVGAFLIAFVLYHES